MWKEVGAAQPPFDWTTGFDIETIIGKMPVKDQNGSGSCGGQAWSYYAAAIEAANTKSFEERSSKYIYSQTFYPNGGGSTGRDNAEIYINQGVARESVLTSYDNGKPPSEAFMERPQDITPEARTDAKLDRSLSYANVDASIEEYATAIKANNGMVMGIGGTSNGSWGLAIPVPPKGKGDWGHWMYCGKAFLLNGVKTIGAYQSWGPGIGDGNWQYFQQAYFDSGNMWGGWTHIWNPNPVTTVQHTFTKQLTYGETDPEVLALQQALQADGEFPATTNCTNYFGTVTLAAVKKFQMKYGVVTTTTDPGYGRVGPKTIVQLNDLFASVPNKA